MSAASPYRGAYHLASLRGAIMEGSQQTKQAAVYLHDGCTPRF
jgi:hypothetical protein